MLSFFKFICHLFLCDFFFRHTHQTPIKLDFKISQTLLLNFNVSLVKRKTMFTLGKPPLWTAGHNLDRPTKVKKNFYILKKNTSHSPATKKFKFKNSKIN